MAEAAKRAGITTPAGMLTALKRDGVPVSQMGPRFTVVDEADLAAYIARRNESGVAFRRGRPRKVAEADAAP